MPVPSQESPFVGEDRVALVDRLVALYDDVATNSSPLWISLEAPSGWGKTRVIQEFYGRIALARQDAGLYWPASILEAVAPEDRMSLTTPDGRRKRVFPQIVEPEEGALPAWMWLGIGCAVRGGTPFQALADDLTQFEQHERGLVARWRHDASKWDKVKHAVTGQKGEEVAGTLGTETFGAAAEALGAGVPGLGFVLLMGKWSLRSLRRREERERDAAPIDAAGTGRIDLVEQLAPALGQIAREVVPLVVVVEDFHLADASLVEVLLRLITLADARVLIITTAWPGLLDQAECEANRFIGSGQGGRLVRLRTLDDGNAAELQALDSDARRALANAALEVPPPGLIDAIAARYTNPLAIELVASYPPLREAIELGTDVLSIVRSLPTDVRDLYYAMWKALPEPVQTLLMLGALASPAAIDAEFGGGDIGCDGPLLTASIEAVDWLRARVPERDGELDRAGSTYAWIRRSGGWLRRFHEPIQREIALELAEHRFPLDHRRSLLAAIADRVQLDGEDLMRSLHHARLILAMEAAGLREGDEKWLQASLLVVQWLETQPDTSSAREVILIAGRAALVGETSDPAVLGLRNQLGSALRKIGRVADALAEFTGLVADLTRILGPEHPETLITRNNLAGSLARAGRIDDAITQLDPLLDDYTRILGPDHPHTLTIRNNLAGWLGQAGRIDDAVIQFTQLLDDRTRILGPDHPETLTTRNNLAGSLGQAGRIDDAITQFTQLLDDRTRILGPDHPSTLITRNNLGGLLGEAGRIDDAITQFTQLLDDRTRILGPDHPSTLITRNNLGGLLGEAGRIDDAITQFTQLLDDRTRILGPDHPDTLTTRNNLAFWLGEAGRTDDAITQFTRLLKDRNRVLGPQHPDTLSTRANLAGRVGEAGRVDEAISQHIQILEDQVRILGPDHPHTLTTRNNLATCLARAGRIDDAMFHLEPLLDDYTRILGPDHPHTLTTRNNLASFLSEAGRVDDAIARFTQLIDDLTRILGPDHPRTLTTRKSLAYLLAGRSAP